MLTPAAVDLSPLLQGGPNRTGLGPHGYVYEDLRVLEATRRLIAAYPQWDIPRMNRLLVESATHPTELERIVKELGDVWREHANKVMGGELADGLTAANATVRRGNAFYPEEENSEIRFDVDEGSIRTRIGDEGIEIELEPPPTSPFDRTKTIERIPIAGHLVRGLATPDGRVTPAKADDGFTFAIDGRSFLYNRRGLRRAE